MTLVQRAHRFDPLVKKALQHSAGVPGCAANKEILGCLTPAFGQPVKVGLEAAGGGDHLLRQNDAVIGKPHPVTEAVIQENLCHLGIVAKDNAKPLGMTAQAVQKRPPATKEKGIGAAKIECAGQGRLEPHPAVAKPACQLGRFLQRQTGKLLIGDTAGDPHQILEIFLKAVGVGQDIRRLLMHGPQIARVARIAATHVTRCRLQHKHRASRLGSSDRGAESGIAGANHQNVPALRKAIVGVCIHLYTGTG